VRFLVILALVCAACGDDGNRCDYTELDDVADGSAAEATKLTVGKTTRTVCGRVEGGHYDNVDKLVDVDRYRITVEDPGLMSVQVDPLEGVEDLASFGVKIFDTATNPTLLADGSVDFAYDHGAFATELAPGDYDLVIAAGAVGDFTEGFIDYRVRMVGDLAKSCPAQTKASYTEKDEAGNGAVTVDYSHTPLAVAGSGTAEETKLTLSSGHRYMFAGTAQAGAAQGQYVDADVFAVKTAKNTDELTVRLDWDDSADLDYLVVEANTFVPAGVSVVTSTGQDELATFAVKPDTNYLLFVGEFMGSTAAAPYGLTVCATHATP
jgi:hypothetical protein